MLGAAELSTDSRDKLRDSTFAFPRLRKMPLNDAAHVRNALARFSQVKGASAEEKAEAKRRIRAAAKRYGVEVASDFTEAAGPVVQPLLVAGPQLELHRPDRFGEVVRLPFVSVGEWNFRDYIGQVQVTEDDLDHLVDNFHRDARRQDLPLLVNEEHMEPPDGVSLADYVGPGAVGYVKDLQRDGDLVMADVELNPLGERLLRDDRYRAVSPELLLEWTDPETDESWGKTAAGLALTTAPRMKGLSTRGAAMVDALAAAEGRVLAFAEIADAHIDGPMQGLSISYAFPQQKRLPLHNAAAVKGARARFMTVAAAEGERDEAWGRVRDAARLHGVEVPASWRELKAGEAAALLMQEGDLTDDDAGLLPPCQYQPPYGSCPGYTRSDPDNDGDADCCAMAARGCNGYIPLISRATLEPPQSAIYGYHEEPTSRGGLMQPEVTETTNQEPGQATAAPAAPAVSQAPAAPAEPTVVAPEAAPAPAVTPAPVTTTTNPAASVTAVTVPTPPPAPVAVTAGADMSEMQNMLAAEKRERQAMAEQLGQAQAAIRTMQAAEGLKAVADRLEACVRSGRISPAEKALHSEHIAHFAENPWLLEALESRPENAAVDFSERGTSSQESVANDRDKLDRAAKQRMSEKGQSTDPKGKEFYANYRAAIVDLTGSGYRG